MENNRTGQNFLWWQRSVTYQVYPRSFLDTNADGIGDLEGVIRQLDYLNGGENSLGIDAIWLSPFYPSPMADFGYDVSDYCNVHPLFGDLATFDRLIGAAHQRKINVIIDYVPNHTSDQHPWFLESRSSRDNPKRDWYLWKDAKPGGLPPNNWGSVFGGGAWEWDESTGQYYFHHFLKEQPDLNWRNPEVRQAMMDVLRFWLARGVDGFRMDVVGMILKDAAFRDNPLQPQPRADLAQLDIFGRQINLYNQDLDEVHEIIQDFRLLFDSYGERVAIGEVWSELPRWVKYYGERGEGLHLPFNFRLIGTPWEAEAVRRSVDELEAALPPFAWPNYVLGSHDVPRLASRIGQAQARVAAMLLLTLRGSPTLYYGDELGLENGLISSEYLQDPQGIRLGLERTRDVARTPMQWDACPQAGFSTAPAWLPVSADFQQRNVAAQIAEPDSLLNLYRRLLALRRASPALSMGSYQPLPDMPGGVYGYLRTFQDEVFLICLNFTQQAKQISLPGLSRGEIVLSTKGGEKGKTELAEVILEGDEGVLLRLTG